MNVVALAPRRETAAIRSVLPPAGDDFLGRPLREALEYDLTAVRWALEHLDDREIVRLALTPQVLGRLARLVEVAR